MNLVITVNLDNEAMREGVTGSPDLYAVSAVLRELAVQAELHGLPARGTAFTARDANGNAVATMETGG